MGSTVLQEFVERLHNSSRRFVPILDPGIPVLPGYRPYDEGIEQDIFIRDVTGQPYIGEVSLMPGPYLGQRHIRHLLLYCPRNSGQWMEATQMSTRPLDSLSVGCFSGM